MATTIKLTQKRKPIRDMFSNMAMTGSEASKTGLLVFGIANVHLGSLKLEAQLEALEDLAGLAGWTQKELAAQKQQVIMQHQAV